MGVLNRLNYMQELRVQLKNKITLVTSSSLNNSSLRGSSLLELIMYIALLLFIFSLCFFWVVHIYIPMIKHSKHSNTMTTFFSGTTRLCHDVYSAPSESASWKKKDARYLVWPNQYESVDTGWRFDKETLMRIEGNYNRANHTWHKSKGGLAIPSMKAFSCSLHETQGTIKTVTSTYTLDNGDIYTHIIALRNRNIS